MSKISVARPGRVNTTSPLRILIILLIFLTIFVVLFDYLTSPSSDRRKYAYRVKCNACLKSLGAAFKIYADEFDGSLPGVESWCDALGQYMIPGLLVCASSHAKEDQSSYAMNKFLDGKKLFELSPDLVLLFESKPGWNMAGGLEILTTEHHEGEGCNVLFADGHVEFVGADGISGLKWTISENNSEE
jgi:prepilin-type processing-associated H-X9-DG protein